MKIGELFLNSLERTLKLSKTFPTRLRGLSWSSTSLPKKVPGASQAAQNRFQKGLSVPSKRKCVLRRLWEEFGTILGHPPGGHLGRKNGSEAAQNSFLFTTKLKHRFQTVWTGFWNGLWHDFIGSAVVIDRTKTVIPPHWESLKIYVFLQSYCTSTL